MIDYFQFNNSPKVPSPPADKNEERRSKRHYKNIYIYLYIYKIDFFLVSDTNSNSLLDYHVIETGLNFSDHQPIALLLELDGKITDALNRNNDPVHGKKEKFSFLRWDHGDKNGYYEHSRILINGIDKQLDELIILCNGNSDIENNDIAKMKIDNIYCNLVGALKYCSDISIPCLKSGSLKFWWNQEMDELKSSSVASFRTWQAAGKPRAGPVHDEMCLHRLRYKKAIRENDTNIIVDVSNDLHDALIKKDSCQFWKTWKSKINKNANRVSIEGYSEADVIVDEFAKFFETSGASNSVKRDLEIYLEFTTAYNNYKNNCFVNNKIKSFEFDTVMIESIISQLKNGKAAGVDELMAEHLKYSHPILCVVLKKLFNLMLEFGYVPASFGIGNIIPIPKGRNVANSYRIQEFRGITISPVLSKVFEHGLLNMFGDYLSSSVYQFGFKKGRGCRDAIFVLGETINNCVSNGSTVNLCTVDVAKAFDKISHKMLFIKLMNRKVPLCFLDILIDWYGKCACQVKWENVFSRLFSIHRGVRQGGILSPILFAVYVDDALEKLIASGLGCRYFGFNIGALMYADDLILMAGSIVNLQKLISLTEDLFNEINLKINIAKCNTMRVGNRCNVKCSDVILSANNISWCFEIKYLGIVFQQANYLKVNVHSCKVKFFQAFNSIYGKIGNGNSFDTIVHLLKSNCLSVLLFNLESVNLTKTNLNNLDFPLHRAFIKIFHVKESNSILWCQYFMNQLPIESLLDFRKRNFYLKLCSTECALLQHFFSESASKYLLQINNKYSIQLRTTNDEFMNILFSKFLFEISV